MLLSFQRPPRPTGKVIPSIQSGCRRGAGRRIVKYSAVVGAAIRRPLARRDRRGRQTSSPGDGSPRPSRRASAEREAQETPPPELHDGARRGARAGRRAPRRPSSSPSTRTPPWAISRRASERETPKASRQRGRHVDRVAVDARPWRRRSRPAPGARRGRGRSAARRAAAASSSWKRAMIARASARFSSRGEAPSGRSTASSSNHSPIASSGSRIVLPNISSGGSVIADLVALGLRHLRRRRRCPGGSAASARTARAGRSGAGCRGPAAG